jgi:hypothetical protein
LHEASGGQFINLDQVRKPRKTQEKSPQWPIPWPLFEFALKIQQTGSILPEAEFNSGDCGILQCRFEMQGHSKS